MFKHALIRHTKNRSQQITGGCDGSVAPRGRSVVTGTTADGEARLTTFKMLVESAANSIAEDLDRGQRYRRQKLMVSRSQRRTSREIRHSSSEREVLADYNRRQVGAQRSFVKAAASARPGTLVLEEFYEPPPPGQPNAELIATLIATMLAAQAEANGRVYLNSVEGESIAAALERAGKALLSLRLPRFAEEAFDQAANIHAKFKDSRAEDRCEFLKSRAHGRAHRWWNPMRGIWALSGLVFGYGYKPLRLLLWIAVVIGGFTAYMLHLPRDNGNTHQDAVYIAVQNFINPMGLGDAQNISPKWEHVLEIETYTGDIMRNIFFVLLIRKWFRL